MTDITNPLATLSAAGVSVWLDDLSRERIVSGGLKKLIEERSVVGVTTNPTIFANALAQGDAYDDQVAELAAKNTGVSDAVVDITTHDVARGCDIFRPMFDASAGHDGRVSIEVEPALAHDTAGTIAQGRMLWDTVDRPNAMIKVPATIAGLDAITQLTALGISVNVTLIFSLERHREVINAYLSGIEKAKAAGIDISQIRSVASFFVSRVDTEVDKRLEAIGTPEALALKGKAGIANARLAYQVFEQAFASERAKGLIAAGANLQRPLWASTGVKDPALRDTLYVEELVAPNVVNTMPEKTMEATFDHGEIRSDTITGNYADANRVLDDLAGLGISYDEVTALLEAEGVDKFTVSWNELLDTVSAALDAARTKATTAKATS
jgi:transaldolase